LGPGDVLFRNLPTQPSASAQRSLDEKHLFSQAISRATAQNASPQATARDAAEQLVAVSLVLPVLKSLRESTGAAAPFAPNAAERSFRQMMDSTLAQRLVKSGSWPLVDRVAQRMLSRLPTPDRAPTAPSE